MRISGLAVLLFILGCIMITLGCIITSVIYFKTLGWSEVKVAHTKDTMQVCSNPGKNFFFRYDNDGVINRNHIHEFEYVVNGVKYIYRDCVAQDTSVKALVYNPVNPQETFPERVQQYLMGGSFVALGIGLVIMGWFSRKFDDERSRI